MFSKINTLSAIVLIVIASYYGVCWGNSSLSNNEKVPYHFMMNSSEKEALLNNLKKVKIGFDVASVKSILGNPTSDERVLSKKGKFLYRILTYYIAIYEKDLVNEKYDQYITLEFNESNLLVKIELKVLD